MVLVVVVGVWVLWFDSVWFLGEVYVFLDTGVSRSDSRSCSYGYGYGNVFGYGVFW